MLSKMYEQLNQYLLQTSPKIKKSDISNKEKQLGVTMPKSMSCFYEIYGNDSDVMNSYYIFEKLENICIEDNALVFGYTHQKAEKIGIELEDLNSEFQSVNYYSDGIWYAGEALYPESFFFNVAGWQILNTLDDIVVIDCSEKEFLRLMNAGFKYFSEDEIYATAFPISTIYFESVIGCYLRKSEEMFLASKDFEILKQLEKNLDLDMDWL